MSMRASAFPIAKAGLVYISEPAKSLSYFIFCNFILLCFIGDIAPTNVLLPEGKLKNVFRVLSNFTGIP